MKEFNNEKVHFLSSSLVTNGVHCDVYEFLDSQEKDLGIIHIKKGYSTPLQEVLEGEKTIEGKILGAGSFLLIKNNQEQIFEIQVHIGDIIQWRADKGTDLECYEVCYPKYQDGRFKNIT